MLSATVLRYAETRPQFAKPADLPAEQPMKVELVVNLKTAKQIGVNIDPNLLAPATRIVK
jgi:putative tryptophan/tyrosine transport system substrate-binding protein